MDIVQIMLVLVVIGVVLYLVNTYIPMAPPIRTILTVVVVVVICLWLLRMFGIGSGGGSGYIVGHGK